ncbi:hypothetical protein E2C01_058818 [Portunus trituberculatus]|uniref:Uncharacterized protein n=1 Tax=Portunus trituberculatus TaxID=210409 RepID=A0A5B7H5R9_PORTR|nr:hypothetical protein [Portunus trituberculatus]
MSQQYIRKLEWGNYCTNRSREEFAPQLNYRRRESLREPQIVVHSAVGSLVKSSHSSPPCRSGWKVNISSALLVIATFIVEKEVIYSVNKFCLEKAKGAPIIDFSKAIARTARATNFSEITVRRICSDINQACETQPAFSSPQKSL